MSSGSIYKEFQYESAAKFVFELVSRSERQECVVSPEYFPYLADTSKRQMDEFHHIFRQSMNHFMDS